MHHDQTSELYIQRKNTESTWQNGYSTDTEIMSQMAADFSSETMEDKEMTCLSSTKRKELLTLNPIPHKNILWEWRRNKDILRRRKTKTFVTRKPTTKRQATGVLGVNNLKRKTVNGRNLGFQEGRKEQCNEEADCASYEFCKSGLTAEAKKKKSHPIWCSAYKKATLYRQLY